MNTYFLSVVARRRVEYIPLQPVASAFVYGVKHLPMTFQVEG
jgi:hypothetical protein